MRIDTKPKSGTVLITSLMTITILSMICATSLYVVTQHQTAGLQIASWQQALSGAESAADQAIRALNTGTWTNWVTYAGAVPKFSQLNPSASPVPIPAVAAPIVNNFNYLSTVNAITFPSGEGSTSVSTWVTVDTAGLNVDNNGNQWYRIRATGLANAPGVVRALPNRLDNDLRNTIGLRFDRKSGASISAPQVTRSIEVITQPLTASPWGRGITLRGKITMSGSAFIDSFDSGNPFKSTNGLWDILKRQSNGSVAIYNSTGSNLNSTYVYGNLTYSGPAIQNTKNVQGTISTPGPAAPAAVNSPGWANGYTNKGSFSGSDTVTCGTKNQPNRYKYSSFTVPGGGVLTITAPNQGTDNNYIEIWVTGNFTTSGSGIIIQDPKVHANIYVGGNLTVSGQSYNNQSGLATNVNFIGYGNSGSVTCSGSGAFIGTINAPNYDITVSGTGSYSGALIGNTLNLSGSGGFHFDEALGKSAPSTVGNYAFASWFEDNSDKQRSITY
jgi:Tfp pilus assembly protein PilX